MIRKSHVIEPAREDAEVFSKLVEEYRYDFERLAWVIFPFGEPGHELEHVKPYPWQIEELRALSAHLMNPATRHTPYRLIISSGNGAAKTSFGCMVLIMLMYTQRLRARVTANTEPQVRQTLWPELDKWFRYARFNNVFFEKFGTSLKAKDDTLAESWRTDVVTWSEQNPAAVSGLHNAGHAICYMFDEAPGIPAIVWDYTKGSFTEKKTIKIFMAFGNSDDPESKFEQNMESSLWRSRRIDTRELEHIDKTFVEDVLAECGGDEDADDFRVRVRGLPRKSSQDSIIKVETVKSALGRREGFDIDQVKALPCILTCDPAWTGGDETVIWMVQGHYACLLEKYKLDKSIGQDHMFTYNILCKWERKLRADAVMIDQGEGTAIYTLANNAGKYWELVSFGAAPRDTANFQHSEYGNLRAQMYYETNKWLMKGAVLDAMDEDWIKDIERQLPWTKGTRHKVHGKKMAESKVEIKKRIGRSPDVPDGLVIAKSRQVMEKLPENIEEGHFGQLGGQAMQMPTDSVDDLYGSLDADYEELYGKN